MNKNRSDELIKILNDINEKTKDDETSAIWKRKKPTVKIEGIYKGDKKKYERERER